MRTIARFMDARNTAEGKFISVLLSALLVFSFLNVTMFTDFANAAEETTGETTGIEFISESVDHGVRVDDSAGQDDLVETGNDDSANRGFKANETVEDVKVDQAGTSETSESFSGANEVTGSIGDKASEEAINQEAQADKQIEESADAKKDEQVMVYDSATGTLTINFEGEITIEFLQENKVHQVKENWDTIFYAIKKDIKSLVLSDTVTSLGKATFEGCDNLEKVEIGGVTWIGNSTFMRCPKLKDIDLENVSHIDAYAFLGAAFEELNFEGDFIGSGAFAHCKAMKTVKLHNVKEIWSGAFQSCSNLESFELVSDQGKETKVIYANLLYECPNIKTVIIDGVETLGSSALSKIGRGVGDDAKSNAVNVVLRNIGLVETSVFDDDFTTSTADSVIGCLTLENIDTIARQAFCCDSLKKVNASNVGVIGDRAFWRCSALEEVSINETKSIGKLAFWEAAALKTVDLTNVTTIGEQAFYGYGSNGTYSELETLHIDGTETIGTQAFIYCQNLKDVSLKNIGIIGNQAFFYCVGLNEVTLDRVGTIGTYAFQHCTNLESIHSLENVGRIDGFAFYGCESLTGLTVEDITKMGFNGNYGDVMGRVESILKGTFKLDAAPGIKELQIESGWDSGNVAKSENWNTYQNGTQLVEQARWIDEGKSVAQVKVDAYYTAEKQMDYIFVADLSASMAQLGNAADKNSRFYDMQSKLLDMANNLLGSKGYDCRIAVVTFGGALDASTPGTSKTLAFTSDLAAVRAHISGLEPLYENTDYGLGMQAASSLAQSNVDRNTVVVFLSDGQPNQSGSGDMAGTAAAQVIRDLNVPIYGVLHSPGSAHDAALTAMQNVCGEYAVYESTDTQSFGKAMNEAFTAVYGARTITIPVNEAFENVANLEVSASAGEASYDSDSHTITWAIQGMPFTKHTLTYEMSLTVENAEIIGTSIFDVNHGNASFDFGGASVVTPKLSRTVTAPVVMGSYRVVHEYYTNGVLDGTYTETRTAAVGTAVRAADMVGHPSYNGSNYVLTQANGSLTVAEGKNDAVTLRYYRTFTNPTPATNPTTNPTPAPTPAAAPTVVTTTPAPAAPAAEAIADDATPQAATPRAEAPEQIEDEGTPMGAFDEPHCWVHWVMLIGILLTAVYGIVVVRRRLGLTNEIDDMEKQVLGVEDAETETVAVAGHQAL